MKKRLLQIGLVIVTLTVTTVYANDILIKDARIYTLTDQGIIERGDILISAGKIAAVGDALTTPATAEVIDAAGKQVTPGLVNAYTHLGLVEIELVKGTVDMATKDKQFSASFAVAPALNPYSTLIPQNRIHGLVRAIVAAESGHHIFAGQGAAIRLGEPESFITNDSVAVFAGFGSHRDKLTGGSRAVVFAKMRQAFIDADEYDHHRQEAVSGNWRNFSLPLHDLEVLIAVLHGNKPLVVSVNRASDILTMLKLKQEFHIRLIVAGAADAWMVADKIAVADVPVILDPMANLPADYNMLGARLDSAARLQAAGVPLLFTGVDWHGTHSAYLVRQAAGNAVAYGMPKIEAIKAMTLNIATAFGFADQFGTIEVGKDADIVIWDGDPLELLTRADQVIIQGKKIPMVSRATRLRDRYRNLHPAMPFVFQK